MGIGPKSVAAAKRRFYCIWTCATGIECWQKRRVGATQSLSVFLKIILTLLHMLQVLAHLYSLLSVISYASNVDNWLTDYSVMTRKINTHLRDGLRLRSTAYDLYDLHSTAICDLLSMIVFNPPPTISWTTTYGRLQSTLPPRLITTL